MGRGPVWRLRPLSDPYVHHTFAYATSSQALQRQGRSPNRRTPLPRGTVGDAGPKRSPGERSASETTDRPVLREFPRSVNPRIEVSTFLRRSFGRSAAQQAATECLFSQLR